MNKHQEKPLLTIIIPVYNVEQYLENVSNQLCQIRFHMKLF